MRKIFIAICALYLVTYISGESTTSDNDAVGEAYNPMPENGDPDVGASYRFARFAGEENEDRRIFRNGFRQSFNKVNSWKAGSIKQQSNMAQIHTDGEQTDFRRMRLSLKAFRSLENDKQNIQQTAQLVQDSQGAKIITDQKNNLVAKQIRPDQSNKRNIENYTDFRKKREAMKLLNDEKSSIDKSKQIIDLNKNQIVKNSFPVISDKIAITRDASFKRFDHQHGDKKNCDINQHSSQKQVGIQSSRSGVSNLDNKANVHSGIKIVNSGPKQLVKSIADRMKSLITDDKKELTKRQISNIENMKGVKAMPKKSVVLDEPENDMKKAAIPLAKLNEKEKSRATSFNQFGVVTRSKRKITDDNIASEATTENIDDLSVQKREAIETTTEDLSIS